jgi:transcriptional regulator with XRE-family HTH domain
MRVLRLKEILTERNIKGEDLAAAIGVTPTTVSNFNQGNTLPKADTLIKIAEYLNLDIPDLFYSSKKTDLQEIFTKDEKGNLKSVGFIKK